MGEGSDIQVEAYYDRTSRREPSLAEVRNTFDVDFVHHLTLPWRQDVLWGLGINVSAGDSRMSSVSFDRSTWKPRRRR